MRTRESERRRGGERKRERLKTGGKNALGADSSLNGGSKSHNSRPNYITIIQHTQRIFLCDYMIATTPETIFKNSTFQAPKMKAKHWLFKNTEKNEIAKNLMNL